MRASRGLQRWILPLHEEIRRHVNEVGVAGTAGRALRRTWAVLTGNSAARGNDRFDAEYGTDTAGVLRPAELDLPLDRIAHAGRYQTAIDDVFLALMRALPIDHSAFTFVDLGSGKGRALLLASRWPFRSIIGVELSQALHRIAERNITIYQSRQPSGPLPTAVCGDASAYPLPIDNLVIYMFNPFDQHVMRAVLSNVSRSYDERPRPIYIAYLKPVHRAVFDESALLRVSVESDRYIIYSTTVAGDENRSLITNG